MIESIKSLFTNKNYMFMLISCVFLYGLNSAIAGVITSFTAPYFYETSDISIASLIFMVSGIFNSFFIGTLLDKYQCYRKALIFLSCASILTMSTAFFALPSKKVGIFAAGMMLIGATLIPVVTVCFSYAAELSYPVPESYSIGIMISISQIFGFLMGLVLSGVASMDGENGPRYGVAIWVGCATIASVFSFLVKCKKNISRILFLLL
jgi:MFS transporter, FLVCR family, feline leukemia virus subgroup C receptor-related protein